MTWGDGIGLPPAHRTRCEECGGWNDGGGPEDCGCRPCDRCGVPVREGSDLCGDCEDAMAEDADDARRDRAAEDNDDRDEPGEEE